MTASQTTGDLAEPSSRTIHTILIEDHTIVREGLKLIIETLDGIRLVGDAGSGTEGMRLFEHLRRQSQRIDVVVTDLGLPDISGLEVARRVKAASSETAVLILSMYADQEHVASILESGVDGYLLKQSSPSELADAIRAVAEGGMALSPAVARRLVNQMHRQLQQEETTQALSERELQILSMLAHGATSKEIAQDLALSTKTVENHRARILEKLDVVNTAAAIGRAYELGLMSEQSRR
jgi:DNA-binding NarL/FixJ family response regulator